MTSKKWNFKTREYEPYQVPEGSKVYSIDMNEIIACAECGRLIQYGDGYTSRKIHTDGGMGYIVCESCYAKEFKEETGHSWYV